jgi:hypothetical protein
MAIVYERTEKDRNTTLASRKMAGGNVTALCKSLC